MAREILFRGFCPNENGDETIILDEEEIVGDWHYWNCFDGINRLNAGFMVTDTVGQWTGLTDKNGKKIFEGGVVIPVWISPSGKIDGLDEDMQGKVIYKAGSFYVVPRCEMEYGIDKFVKRKFIEYRSNVGRIYDFENNVFLGEVIGTIFDKEGV